MPLRLQPSGIADEIVLGAREGILIEQSDADRAVVDDRLGLPQFERRELIDEGQFAAMTSQLNADR
jgi:hypothetical protein